jgi:hypothetical protein
MWDLQTTNMREDQYNEIREIIAKEVKVIHAFIKKNPLLERGEAVRVLIKAGKIREVHPSTHLLNYGKKHKRIVNGSEVLERELEIIKKYITEKNIPENLDKLRETVELLRNNEKIRSSTSLDYTIRIYRKRYAPNLKEKKGIKTCDSTEMTLTLKIAKKNVEYYEKYNFEGRIMTKEMRKSFELVKK